MWYYSLNNQPAGPVDDAAIKSLLASGTINLNTLVWQEGMADWKKLAETVLAPVVAPVAPVPPPAYPPVAYPPAGQYAPATQYAPAPQYAPAAGVPGTPPPFFSQVKLASLKGMFIWWLVLFAISTVSSLLTPLITDQDAIVAISCIVSTISLGAAVLFLVLLYNFWKILQDGYAEVTPGKAVGFLFIPFFNFYWAFKAFWGLAKEQNNFIDRHYSMAAGSQIQRANPVIPLIFCILYLVNLTLTVVNSIMTANGDTLYANGGSGMLIVITVFSLIFAAFEIVTYLGLFKTSTSILEHQQGR